MRELVGKAILVGISAILSLFIGNEFYWVAGFSAWFAHAISLVATIAISWFLLSESKPRRRRASGNGSAISDRLPSERLLWIARAKSVLSVTRRGLRAVPSGASSRPMFPSTQTEAVTLRAIEMSRL